MTVGIYKISRSDNDFYIGSSINIERRFIQHKSELRRGCHTNHRLQSAFVSSNNQLQFEVLACAISEDFLVELEQFFIDSLRPTLNLSSIAHCSMLDPVVRKKSSEAIKKSEAHGRARSLNQKKASAAVSKRVIRLNDGMVFESGYAAAKFHGEHSKDNIGVAIKKGWRFAGHFWCYEDNPKSLEEIESAWKQRDLERKNNASKAATKSRSKKVIRLSDGKVFASAVDAARQMKTYRTMVTDAIHLNVVRAGSKWAYV